MSPVHIHLLLNHVPVIGTIVAILVLAYALLRRSTELTRVGLGMFVLVALVAAAVYLTGEPAEHLVEDLAGVSEPIIERHEDAALLATLLLGGLGALALGGLVMFRRAASVPRGFGMLVLALSIVPAAAMAWTANLGGQIRHSEIRPAGVVGSPEQRNEHGRSGTAAFFGLAGPATAYAQGDPATATIRSVQPEIPAAMRAEHVEIHEALLKATRTPGRVGAAAREVARVLEPHFEREEQIALPPLGLLPALARGDEVAPATAATVLSMTDALKAELPGMLDEHRRIAAALERLIDVARAERRPEEAQLAEKILLHAQMEEQVNYPAAVLVGEVVQSRQVP